MTTPGLNIDEPESPRAPVVDRLSTLVKGKGLTGLSARLSSIGRMVKADLGALEQELECLEAPPGSGPRIVRDSASHLLSRPGKRLRPLCVLLAARVGQGATDATRRLAVSVELVHAATLLHDDVVDLGDMRRGAPAARAIYGNAASVFAGDWLLIEALRRVRGAELPDVLERLLDTIDLMIDAEALQLERRGTALSRAQYLEVIDGKTASLFRWAFWAGGRSGGLPEDACFALERFGHHLGVAFQIVDDVLDFAGDAEDTGKHLLADLREGKFTYPLLEGIARDDGLVAPVTELLAADGDEPALCRDIVARLRATGALEHSMEIARAESERARDHLSRFPTRGAVRALDRVAAAAVERKA